MELDPKNVHQSTSENVHQSTSGTPGSSLDPVVPAGGNTSPPPKKGKSQIPPAKKWCFTWNNAPEDWYDIIVPKFQESGLFGCQPEIGKKSGIFHIQGWCEFKTKIRPSSLGLPTVIHWEKMRGTIEQSLNYCNKENTKAGDYVTNKKMPRALPTVSLYGWQVEADEKLNAEPDAREIFWIWSRSGSKGKSTFVRHLAQNRKALVCAGKASDMKYLIVKYHETHKEYPEIVVLDVPRSMKDYLSYTGIEEIKNGVFASQKYECNMVVMPHAHVVILANFEPNMNDEDMSSDRFTVWDIEDRD